MLLAVYTDISGCAIHCNMPANKVNNVFLYCGPLTLEKGNISWIGDPSLGFMVDLDHIQELASHGDPLFTRQLIVET